MTLRTTTTPAMKHMDVFTALLDDGSFSTFARALRATGLDKALAGEDAFYTVFAPTDKAFARFASPEELEALFADREQLSRMMLYHLVPRKLEFSHLDNRIMAQTLEGEHVFIDSLHMRVNDSDISRSDLVCRNGVIHVIDSVLLVHRKGDPHVLPNLTRP